jgi:AcrR family transcriptional regulator
VVDGSAPAGLGLRERKKQRTRAILIDAAVELCESQGFERTTVDQIAAVADVSPRTFSRYFATKDAVVLAFIDDVAEVVASELARQPADIGHLDALFRSHVQAFENTKTAPPSGLTEQRLLASARIVNSSEPLKHAAFAFRQDAVNAVLAERMGVARDDRRLRLVATTWGAIFMTAVGDLGRTTDWDTVTVDDILSRLTRAYAQFVDVAADVIGPL